MKHRVTHKRLKRDVDHRKALLFNLASNLVANKAVVTTTQKAKFVKSFVEKLVTKAKSGDTLHNRRVLLSKLRNDKALVDNLFNKISKKYKTRNGGYLSIQKMKSRDGDNASMSKIFWVAGEETEKEKNKTAEKTVKKESSKKVKTTKKAKDTSVEKEDKPAKKVSKKVVKKSK